MKMTVTDIQGQTPMEQLENKADASLKKVINEIKDLKDNDKENDTVELNGILNDDFKNRLGSDNAKILLDEMTAIEQSILAKGELLPDGFEDLRDFLQSICEKAPTTDNGNSGEAVPSGPSDSRPEVQPEVIEKPETVDATKINITLRGNLGRGDEAQQKQRKEAMANTLNGCITGREHLSNDQKKVLVLAKAALEGGVDNNGISSKVEDLQKELNDKGKCKLDTDGKFGSKTYDALIGYLNTVTQTSGGSSPDVSSGNDNIEVQPDVIEKPGAMDAAKINIPLKGEWKNLNGENLNAKKQELAKKINEYINKRDSLSKDQQSILVLAKAALEGGVDNNGISSKVKDLQTKLNSKGDYKLDTDGKFGPNTYNALIKYLSIVEKPVEQPTAPDTGTGSPDTTNEPSNNPDNSQETTENQGEGSISFSKLRDTLPIKDNTDINTIMGTISALDNQLNEGKSINELSTELEDINSELADIQRQQDEIKGSKSVVESNIKDKIAEKRSKKQDLETKRDNTKNKKEKKQIEGQITALDNEIISLEETLPDNQIKRLEQDKKPLNDQKKAIEDQLKKKNEIKGKITDNLTQLKLQLEGELAKPENADKKDKITAYITETIPQYIKGLDGEVKAQNDPKATVPEATTTTTTTSSVDTGKKTSGPITFKELLDRLSNFEWKSGGGFGGFINNLINFFSELAGGTGNIDKFKGKDNIEFNNETVKAVLSLVQRTHNVNGIEQIKKTLEDGTEEKIRELQMALWTPTNNLMITGKIDEQTAKILKSYIENKDNAGTQKDLGFECLKGFTTNNKPISVSDKVGGYIYTKTNSYGKTETALKGTINGKSCVALNITHEEKTGESGGKQHTITADHDAIIQYSDGTKEVGKFDGDLKLIEGTRYSGGKEEKVTATTNPEATGTTTGNPTTTDHPETTSTTVPQQQNQPSQQQNPQPQGATAPTQPGTQQGA